MAEWIGIGRRGRRCYGFDEIALVPGAQTVNPEEVDTSFEIDGKKFKRFVVFWAFDGKAESGFRFYRCADKFWHASRHGTVGGGG